MNEHEDPLLQEIIKLLEDLQVSVDNIDVRTEKIAERLGILPPEDGGDEA